MNRKTLLACLALVVVFQIAVLAAEYLGAVYPLWTGVEVRLKTVPVDPRSIFMGNYARLKYDISTVDSKDWSGKQEPRNGEFVYVRLKPGADGQYWFDGISPEKPESGLFIRGRLKDLRRNPLKFEVRYGIEAYFAPEKKAQLLEKEMGQGGVAVVMVAGNGKAALKEVIPAKDN